MPPLRTRPVAPALAGALHRKLRTRERRRERQPAFITRDACELLRRPVARDLAQLHPQQIVEARVQPPHDFLEDLESQSPGRSSKCPSSARA